MHWKDQKLHNEKGASVLYSDGYGLYTLNGTQVPEWMVKKSAGEIDSLEILKLKNAQQRAEGIRKIGIERLWHKKAKILDKDGDYELGLLPLSTSKGDYWPYLKMKNPSVPELWHVEAIDKKDCMTVKEALHYRKPQWMRDIPVSENGQDWWQQGDVVIVPENAKFIKPKPFILT